MKSRKLIFVVDDDSFINQLIMKRFNSDNILVETYQYGEECIEYLGKKPSLIILDYHFFKPGIELMNGIDVLNSVRKLNKRVPIIMMTDKNLDKIISAKDKRRLFALIQKDSSLITRLEAAIVKKFGSDIL